MVSDDEPTLQRLIRDAQDVADRSAVGFLPFERLDGGFRITASHGESGAPDEKGDQEFVYLSDLVERASSQNLLIESVCRIEARMTRVQEPERRVWVGKPSPDE